MYMYYSIIGLRIPKCTLDRESTKKTHNTRLIANYKNGIGKSGQEGESKLYTVD